MPDPSFFLPLLFQSAVVPFGVALVVLASARALRPGAMASSIAVAAGFVAAFVAALHAQWSPAPKTAMDWLPWIAAAGTAGAIGAERIAAAWPRLFARLAVSLVAAGLTLSPAVASLGMPRAAFSAAVTGALICAVWSRMARIASDRPTPPLLLAVVAGGAGLALMLDSSQSIGQMSGALAAALAACAAFNLPRVRMMFSPAGAGAAVLLLGTLLANAHFYAGFSLAYIALLACGLLADPLVEHVNRLHRRSSGPGSWATATMLAAMPVAVTIGLAVKAAQDAGGY